MTDLVIQYLGGTPYPVFELFIVLTIVLLLSSIYFGLKFESIETPDEAKEIDGGRNDG